MSAPLLAAILTFVNPIALVEWATTPPTLECRTDWCEAVVYHEAEAEPQAGPVSGNTPVSPDTEVPGTEVDFDQAMREMYREREAEAKSRGGVIYQVAMQIPDGTCRYVELHGQTLLVKARFPFPIDVTGDPGRKHWEAINCPGGTV